jgi:hypothetical protein
LRGAVIGIDGGGYQGWELCGVSEFINPATTRTAAMPIRISGQLLFFFVGDGAGLCRGADAGA